MANLACCEPSKDPEEWVRAVSGALALMAGTLAQPRPITDDVVAIWVRVLQMAGLSLKDVQRGTEVMIGTATFFPTPADFIKTVRPPVDLDAKAELAWQRVKSAISRFGGYASLTSDDFAGDGAALWSVSRMGWADLCAELDAKNENLKRATFVRIYQMAVKEGQSLSRMRGTMERDNELRNHNLDPALCGRPDWQKLPSGDDGPVEEFRPLKPEAIKALVAKIGTREEG